MIGQIFKSNITKGFGDECVQSVESTSLTSLPFLLLNICIPPLRALTSPCACNCRNGTYLSSSCTSLVLSSLYPSTISPLRVYFRHLVDINKVPWDRLSLAGSSSNTPSPPQDGKRHHEGGWCSPSVSIR